MCGVDAAKMPHAAHKIRLHKYTANDAARICIMQGDSLVSRRQNDRVVCDVTAGHLAVNESSMYQIRSQHDQFHLVRTKDKARCIGRRYQPQLVRPSKLLACLSSQFVSIPRHRPFVARAHSSERIELNDNLVFSPMLDKDDMCLWCMFV